MLMLFRHVLESSHEDDLRHLTVCSLLIGDKAVNELLCFAGDPRALVSQNALTVLGQLGAIAYRAVPELQRIYREGPESCREGVLEALLNLISCGEDMEGTPWSLDEQVVMHLLDDAAAVELSKKRKAKTAFIALGASAVDGLVSQMQGRHPGRRRTAAEALGWLGTAATSAIPALQEATKGRDDILQNKARIALTKIRRIS
ncbi:MAG: hypothetical protein ACYC0X_12465 [Pirellulaceae bacterium]